jgi:hypothetical protein
VKDVEHGTTNRHPNKKEKISTEISKSKISENNKFSSDEKHEKPSW